MYLHPLFQEADRTDKKFVVFYGPRAGMKTRSTAKVMLGKALRESCLILCTRKYQSNIEESVYGELVYLINTYKQYKGRFTIHKRSIVCNDTGSRFIFMGMQHIAEIKSMVNIKYVWIEEANYIDEQGFETLSKTIRKPGAQIWIIFNPHLKEDYVYDRFVINKDRLAFVRFISWKDNPFFSRKYVGTLVDEREADEQKDQHLYKWIWEGEPLQQLEGAIFKQDWFKYQHIDYTRMERLSVNIDPSGSSNDKSDACGLTVTGRLGEYYYLFDDQTAVMTPAEWAKTAVNLYHKYKADKIIYESNYGGDIVKTVIKQIDNTVPCQPVRATRGKIIRAEPIASLYEQGLVIHVKRFPELEYEATTYTGDPKEKSPNRLDSLVWGISSLIKKNTNNSHQLVGIKF